MGLVAENVDDMRCVWCAIGNGGTIIYKYVFKDKAGMWTALFTAGLVYFSALLYRVSDRSDVTQRTAMQAFLFVSGVSIALPSGNAPGGAVIHMQNSGSTPAYNVMIDNNICTRRMPLSKEFGYPSYAAPSGPTMVPPKIESLIFLQLGNKYLNDVVGALPKRLLYVWGNVTYQDAFGVAHRAEFCDQYTASATIGGQSISVFTQCPSHNCADQYCKDTPPVGHGDVSKDCPE